jgi:hypothetical protein
MRSSAIAASLFNTWSVADPVGWWSAGLGGWEELGSPVVAEADLPGGVVEGAVVVAAEQHQVV